MTTFLRVEMRNGNLVAVFDRGGPVWRSNGGVSGYYDDGTFCLDEKSLRARITRIKRDGHDTSAEEHALTTMVEIARNQNTFPDKGGNLCSTMRVT